MVKLGGLVRMDLEPIRRPSALPVVSLRKLEANQGLIACRWSQRVEGGKVELSIICARVEVNIIVME